jgi:hypothetical protein
MENCFSPYLHVVWVLKRRIETLLSENFGRKGGLYPLYPRIIGPLRFENYQALPSFHRENHQGILGKKLLNPGKKNWSRTWSN